VDSPTFDSTGYDVVAFAVKWEGPDTVVTVADNKGSGAYTPLTKVNHSNGDLNIRGFWKHIGTPGSGHIVTASFVDISPYQGVGLWLVNSTTGAILSLDVESVAQGFGATHDAGSLATTAAASLHFVGGSYATHDHTAGSGWTLDAEGSAAEYLAYQSRLEAAAGTFDPVATSNTSSDWVAISMAFREATSGATAGPSRNRKKAIHPGQQPGPFGARIRSKRNKTVVALPTVTGTVAVALGSDTVTAQGSPIVPGSLAVTLGNDTLAASGVISPIQGSRRSKTPVHPGAGPYNLLRFKKSTRNTSIATATVSGGLAATLGNDALAAAGSPIVNGAASATLGGDALAAQGATTVIGSLAVTIGSDALAAAGTSTVPGTLAVTLGDDALSASGSVGGAVTGTLAVTLGDDALAASGVVTVAGTLAKTLANDTLAAQGTVSVNGSLSATLGSDTLSAQGNLTITGSLAKTLGNDTLDAYGTSGNAPAAVAVKSRVGIAMGVGIGICLVIGAFIRNP
jgi:hypothetical protein